MGGGGGEVLSINVQEASRFQVKKPIMRNDKRRNS